MKKIPPHRSKRWLTGAAAGLAALAPGARLAAAPWVPLPDLPLRRAATLGCFVGGYEGVLGTSLDLIVEAARPADAIECERRLLDEIERLRKICSTYDESSEISRVRAGAGVESAELTALLAAYATWAGRTNGLIALNLDGVIAEWREAARTGRLPDRATLAQASRRARAFNVDALGKAFIIDRAVVVARRFAPGGLLNLGGDIRVWGDTAWPIGIADPRHPEENAPPLARFTLHEAAVATSGGYARFFNVGARRFSHLIDPRSSWPLSVGGSATVVARDSVTANALATATSIGGSEAGAALAQAHGATGYLFAETTGGLVSGGLLATAGPTPAPPAPATGRNENPPAAPAAAVWPAGFQVTVPVALKKIVGPREIYRPYVVVWIENAQDRVVRTLTLWGNDERYQRKLSTWLRQLDRSESNFYTTGRATRAPGAYTLTWDGKDDVGQRLPAGSYKIVLELCREEGHHVVSEATLVCGPAPTNAGLAETAESDAAIVTYGPPKT